MRKLILLSATVIVLVAVGAMPAAGRAETGPHWFSEGKLLSGEPMSVTGRGEIQLEPKAGEQLKFYDCRIKASEVISNPPGGGAGTDELVAAKFSNCSQGREAGFCGFFLTLQVFPLGLPWHSHLAVGVGNTVDDVFEGAALELRCKTRRKKGPSGVFSGTLSGVFEGMELGFADQENKLSSGSEPMYLSGGVVLKVPGGRKKITAA